MVDAIANCNSSQEEFGVNMPEPNLSMAALSFAPHVRLERNLDRWLRDTSGIVCDGGRGHDRDNLEEEIFAETCIDKFVHIPVIKVSALLDQASRQDGERGILAMLWRAPFANGVDVCLVEPFLECESRMKRNRPRTSVCDRVGEKNDLNLRLRKTAAMNP